MSIKINKDNLSQIEEMFSAANYRLQNIEIICAPYSYGEEVEFEVYAGSDVAPYYFYLPIYVFEKYLAKYLDMSSTLEWIQDDLTRYQKQELKDIGDMYWYNELAPEKEQIEAAEFILNEVLTELF